MSEQPTSDAPPAVPVSPPARSAVASWLVSASGALVALAGGLLTGVLGLVLVPLRLDTPLGLLRMPVAVVFVILANAAWIWFARYTTQARWGPLVPAAGWLLIAFAAARGASPDGSLLLLGNDWVGVLTIFGGTATVAIGAVVALTRRPQPGTRP